MLVRVIESQEVEYNSRKAVEKKPAPAIWKKEQRAHYSAAGVKEK